MIESKDLELQSSLTIGKLETNAAMIYSRVEQELKNYKPENFANIKEAKDARALLNNAAKELNSKRILLEKKWNEPLEKFKNLLNSTCGIIQEASGQLDKIIKQEESKEKDEKRQKIQEIWDAQNFTFYGLEKIFNKKWLNKSVKLSEVEAEIKEKISGTFSDLEVIDNFPPDDIPLIKSIYLKNLSLKEAAAEAKELEQNREKLAKEAQQKQQHAINMQLEEQHQQEQQEGASAKVDDLVNEAYNTNNEQHGLMTAPQQEPPAQLESYALRFTGPRVKLIRLKKYMTDLGITYIKLEENEDGTYSL